MVIKKNIFQPTFPSCTFSHIQCLRWNRCSNDGLAYGVNATLMDTNGQMFVYMAEVISKEMENEAGQCSSHVLCFTFNKFEGQAMFS